MKNIVLILLSLLLFTSCKKNIDVTVKMTDVGLQRPIADVEVDLIEYKSYKSLTGTSWAPNKILETKTTDQNGTAVFNDIKVQRSHKYDYGVRCKANSITQGEVLGSIDKKSKSSTVNLNIVTYGRLQIGYTNLFIPGQSGDDITVTYSIFPGYSKSYYLSYDSNAAATPPDYMWEWDKLKTGYINVTVKKKKLGVTTEQTTSVFIDRDKTTLFIANW